MSEQRIILADAVTRLFREAAAEPTAPGDHWNEAHWRQVEDMGLPLLLVPEAAGGIGGNWEDAFVVLQAVGHFALALPVAETMLAMRLAALGGFDLPSGALSFVPFADGRLEPGARIGSARYTGTVAAVPWGRHATTAVSVIMQDGQEYLALLPCRSALSIATRTNLAGEPRDTLRFEAADVIAGPCAAGTATRLQEFGALLRVVQIAGALERVLALSVGYAKERTQFGKSIASFQAVQQQLARLGAETAAAGAAARAACRAADHADASFEIAAAKLRANLAIGESTTIAHQVHGAIGFTREYELRRFSQRLWSWRSEFGNDRHWSAVLGSAIAARGADAFWPDLTERGDRAAQCAVP